jgi:hypothetical protein
MMIGFLPLRAEAPLIMRPASARYSSFRARGKAGRVGIHEAAIKL